MKNKRGPGGAKPVTTKPDGHQFNTGPGSTGHTRKCMLIVYGDNPKAYCTCR